MCQRMAFLELETLFFTTLMTAKVFPDVLVHLHIILSPAILILTRLT